MDVLMDLFRGLTKRVFLIIAAVVLAMLLYQVLFGGNTNATTWMCNAARTPMAKYYYELVYKPEVESTSGIASELGYSVDAEVTDLDANDVDTFGTPSTDGRYSTGWY